MRLKSELYEKEQEKATDKTITVLDLEHKKKHTTLYESDENEEIQNKITESMPETRKWFSFNGIKALGSPSENKRPWLSITKQFTKTNHKPESEDFQFT